MERLQNLSPEQMEQLLDNLVQTDPRIRSVLRVNSVRC